MTSNGTHAYELRETLLKVEDVSLELGGRPILRNVQLELKNLHRPGMTQGQVVGLLGPSGVGKTQLFRILAGLNTPDTGRALLGPEAKPVRAGMVGVVAQNYPLFEHRTVMGNLMVAGKQGGMTALEAQQKSKELLARFHLDEHEGKFPVQLSGGQRQRVAIMQQFMCSDFLLLMDEPFSGLDPLALDRMCDFICEVAASDELKTFIVVTHDISAAVTVCDTLWLLGREQNPDGSFIPGAYLQQTIDLVQRGLAWRPDLRRSPEFQATINEVHDRFKHL